MVLEIPRKNQSQSFYNEVLYSVLLKRKFLKIHSSNDLIIKVHRNKVNLKIQIWIENKYRR